MGSVCGAIPEVTGAVDIEVPVRSAQGSWHRQLNVTCDG